MLLNFNLRCSCNCMMHDKLRKAIIERSDYFSHEGYYDFYNSLKKVPYSYYPLVDACIVRKISPHFEGDRLVTLWNKWFKDIYESPNYESQVDTVLDFISKNTDLYYHPYEIFQHEIRAHRLPIVYSSLGPLIAYLQFNANQTFTQLLKIRGGKQKVSKSLIQRLFQTEKYLNEIFMSIRYVVESLAVFRDVIINYKITKLLNKNSSLDKTINFMLSFLQSKVQEDKKRFMPYLVGFKMSLAIFDILDFWGVEAAATYALNPTLTKIDFQKYNTSPFLRYNEIANLLKKDIPANLDVDNQLAIDNFIRNKFNWSGRDIARDMAIDITQNISPEIIRSGLPSKDFFLSSNDRGTVIPEFIFVQSGEQKSLLARSKNNELDKLVKNFLVSLFRKKAAQILSTGKIEPSYCPFLAFYGTSDLCKFYSEGASCDIMKHFCDVYKLSFHKCSGNID